MAETRNENTVALERVCGEIAEIQKGIDNIQKELSTQEGLLAEQRQIYAKMCRELV